MALIERFNRTIREKIDNYLEQNKTNRFIDVLDDIVLSYNNTYHNGIKGIPNKINE